MKTLVLTTITGMVLFLASCGDESAKTTHSTEKEEVKKPASCTYNIDESKGLTLRWIAYKHTAKVPVEGVFTGYSIKGGLNPVQGLPDYIKTLEIWAETQTVSTQDTGRDGKIERFFFGLFKSPETIKGKITSAEGNDKTGKGTIEFTMNEVSFEVPFEYSLRESGELTLSATIDVNNWSAQASVESLNDACEEKHTGDDGASVLWPEVKIVLSGFLKQTCP
jgi:hypothetical protein